MADPPNIGGALSVQGRKVWLMPTSRVPCSNAAKTQNPLKFAGVPQTRQQISAISRLGQKQYVKKTQTAKKNNV